MTAHVMEAIHFFLFVHAEKEGKTSLFKGGISGSSFGASDILPS